MGSRTASRATPPPWRPLARGGNAPAPARRPGRRNWIAGSRRPDLLRLGDEAQGAGRPWSDPPSRPSRARTARPLAQQRPRSARSCAATARRKASRAARPRAAPAAQHSRRNRRPFRRRIGDLVCPASRLPVPPIARCRTSAAHAIAGWHRVKNGTGDGAGPVGAERIDSSIPLVPVPVTGHASLRHASSRAC